MRREAFRQLPVGEAGSDADTTAIASGARRLCERFAQQRTPIIGDAGMAAICSRSLHVALRQLPSPTPICAQTGDPCGRLQVLPHELEPGGATEAVVDVLTTARALLDSFIGQALTTRLLRDVWPDAFDGDTQETP
jgi:hypothetical protein